MRAVAANFMVNALFVFGIDSCQCLVVASAKCYDRDQAAVARERGRMNHCECQARWRSSVVLGLVTVWGTVLAGVKEESDESDLASCCF